MSRSAADKLKAFRFEPYLSKDLHGEDFRWNRFNKIIGDFYPIDKEAHKIAVRIGDLMCNQLLEIQDSIEKGELPQFIKDKIKERDANIEALDHATNKTIPQEILEKIREFYPFWSF